MRNARVRLKVKLGIDPEEIERAKSRAKFSKELDEFINKQKKEKEALQKRMEKLNRMKLPYVYSETDPNRVKPMEKRFTWENGREKR